MVSDFASPNSLHNFAIRSEEYSKASLAIRVAVQARMDDDGLNCHSITARVKSYGSLADKLGRKDSSGSDKYPEGIKHIDDLIGVRVILFVESDIPKAVEALSRKFEVIEDEDKTQDHKDRGVIGYMSRHLVLRVPEDGPPAGCAPHVGHRFEVQIRTVLQHAWAEFEHDVRYKGRRDLPTTVDRAFTAASLLIELADQQFSRISETVAKLETLDELREREGDSEVDGPTLLELLSSAFPEYSRSRLTQYDWLAEVVRAMGIDRAEQLAELLGGASSEILTKAIGYKFAPGHVRIADDFFLSTWGDEYIEKTGSIGDDSQRRTKLENRLDRIRSSQAK